MLCRVQPGSLRGSGGLWVSVGHAWLSVALGRELSSQPCCGPQQPRESGRAAASTPGAAAAIPAFGAAHFSTRYSPLTLFQADASRSCCRKCETSARLGKAGVGLHQAVVAEVAPAGATELFCCLSSFIFAPSLSPVLCTQGSPAPPERLGACSY